VERFAFVLYRPLQLIPVLFGVSAVSFLLVHSIPGDPVRILLGTRATAEVIAKAPETQGGKNMAKYIALASCTDQGIRNIKDSPGRGDAARKLVKKYGCDMQDFYMTIGTHDMVVTIEAPDDDAMAKFALALGTAGNVRTTTLKAFTEDSYRKIIGAL